MLIIPVPILAIQSFSIGINVKPLVGADPGFLIWVFEI
jgi:hypothetical protein